jgi:uncharacterized protein YcbX
MLPRDHRIAQPAIRYRSQIVPTLGRISVAPVKSLALLHPPQVHLGPDGAALDRVFFLADPWDRLVTGADHGPLVQVRSAFDPSADRLRLTFPDGSSVEGAARASGPALRTDFYGRPVAAREVEGPFGEALSAYTGRAVRLARVDRAGDAAAVYHLTLVSAESVAELGRRGGRGPDLDGRRFRMLLEIQGCAAPHEEDTWDGRDVRVGEAVIRIHGQVPRCVVTTQDPETGRKDFDTLKTINRYRELMRGDDGGPGLPFGVYAETVTPGTVRIGDPVEPR